MGQSGNDDDTPVRSPDRDDATLLSLIAAGDQSAWKELVERHLGFVVAMAWRVIGNRQEAEDVAQETFIRLIKKAPNWETGTASLRAWLARVAINLAIDRKRAGRTVPLETESANEPSQPPPAIERRLDIERSVRTAMHQLPERQAAALALVHYEQFSGVEAADFLNISVEALESLLARGRRSLRAALSGKVHELLEGES
jgi:RNA polymerase sigma-70 factor (ECF subfamily)